MLYRLSYLGTLVRAKCRTLIIAVRRAKIDKPDDGLRPEFDCTFLRSRARSAVILLRGSATFTSRAGLTTMPPSHADRHRRRVDRAAALAPRRAGAPWLRGSVVLIAMIVLADALIGEQSLSSGIRARRGSTQRRCGPRGAARAERAAARGSPAAARGSGDDRVRGPQGSRPRPARRDPRRAERAGLGSFSRHAGRSPAMSESQQPEA